MTALQVWFLYAAVCTVVNFHWFMDGHRASLDWGDTISAGLLAAVSCILAWPLVAIFLCLRWNR